MANISELEHPDVRVEPTDLSSRKVIWTGAGILGGTWLFAILIFVGFKMTQQRVPTSPVLIKPPEPMLQTSPRTDLQRKLSYENELLHKYSWVDQSRGVVTIPIERAMEIIARRGIPPQKNPPELKLYPPGAGSRDTGFREEPR